MSYFSKYVWNPFIATLARAKGSSHAATSAAAAASLDAIGKLGQDVHDGLSAGLTPNSAAAVKSAVVKDLENGLKATVDAFLMAAAPVGLNGLAVEGANFGIDWVEGHTHDFIASLFHHAKTNGGPDAGS